MSATPPAANVAIVPLRSGSKGLPGKNLRPLLGRPLYRHTLDQALAAGLDAVVITTDIEEVLGADHPPEVTVHQRPAELCADETPMAHVLTDALQLGVFDDATVVLLQATSPLRRAGDIRRALERHGKGDFDLVMSVTSADPGALKCGTLAGDRFVPLRSSRDTFANRQSLPSVVRPNGAIYVFGAAWYRTQADLATDNIGVLKVDPETSADIDSLEDFNYCARVLAQRDRTEQ